MAEQIQNTDYSKYDKFLVNEEKQSNDVVITPTTEKESDVSKYDKFIVVDDKQKISTEPPKTIETVSSLEGEPSWWRKFTYGFDKQDQFLYKWEMDQTF